MKSFRTTWIMGVLVALLAGYTAWEYKKAGSETDSPQEKKLFNFKNDDVEQLKIRRTDQTLVIDRDHDGWRMKQPVVDLVEPSAMDAVLYSILVQKGKIFRSEEDPKTIKWSEFGLDPAGSVVEVKTKSGTQTLEVSSKNAFDGSFYLRQGDQLMLGEDGLAQAVLREPKTYRTKRLWREPDAKVESVEATVNADGRKDKFTLQRNGEHWTLNPKPAFALDPAKLDLWVNNIQALRPNEIVSDIVNDDEKRSDLLLKPSLTVVLNYKKPDGSPTKWILTAGQDRDEDIFMYTNQQPTIYKSGHSSLDRIRVDRAYFRDGKKAFHFPMEQVREVEVHDGTFSHRFKKSDLVWTLEGDGKSAVGKSAASKEELDQDKLIQMMQKLSALEAQEFVPASAAKGFKPEQRIVLRGDQRQVIFDFSWGDEYKAKSSFNHGMTLRFAKTGLEKETMGLTNAKIVNLVDKHMVKTPAPPAPAVKAKAQ